MLPRRHSAPRPHRCRRRLASAPPQSDDAATHAAKRPAPPPRCYCDRPAVRLGDRFVCPLPDTRNYCTFGREDKLRIVPRFGIPAALAPKKP